MDSKNNVRAGIWVRVLSIGIGLPVICVWGAPKTGLIIIVAGWILGGILDAGYADKQAAENKKKAEENHAILEEKLNKYRNKNNM